MAHTVNWMKSSTLYAASVMRSSVGGKLISVAASARWIVGEFVSTGHGLRRMRFAERRVPDCPQKPKARPDASAALVFAQTRNPCGPQTMRPQHQSTPEVFRTKRDPWIMEILFTPFTKVLLAVSLNPSQFRPSRNAKTLSAHWASLLNVRAQLTHPYLHVVAITTRSSSMLRSTSTRILVAAGA